MELKEKITEAVNAIAKDEQLQALFKKDPVKAIEQVLGIDLPDDIANQVVAGVKAKLTTDTLSGAVDALKKLF